MGVHWSACVRNNLLVSCRGFIVTSTSEQKINKQTNKQKEKLAFGNKKRSALFLTVIFPQLPPSFQNFICCVTKFIKILTVGTATKLSET